MISILSLNKRDIINGKIVAFLSAAVVCTTDALDAGQLHNLDALKSDLFLGLKAAGAYLLKNIFTNNAGTFGSADSK